MPYGSMHDLTQRQQQIVDFIRRRQQASGLTPSFQEIAEHFGFRSPTTVADHLRLIRKKGVLASEPGRASLSSMVRARLKRSPSSAVSRICTRRTRNTLT